MKKLKSIISKIFSKDILMAIISKIWSEETLIDVIAVGFISFLIYLFIQLIF